MTPKTRALSYYRLETKIDPYFKLGMGYALWEREPENSTSRLRYLLSAATYGLIDRRVSSPPS